MTKSKINKRHLGVTLKSIDSKIDLVLEMTDQNTKDITVMKKDIKDLKSDMEITKTNVEFIKNDLKQKSVGTSLYCLRRECLN